MFAPGAVGDCSALVLSPVPSSLVARPLVNVSQ